MTVSPMDYLVNGQGNDRLPEESERIRKQGTKREGKQHNSHQLESQSRLAFLRGMRHMFDTHKEIQKTEYIGGLFPRGYVSVIVGASGVGKTIFEQRIFHDLSHGGDIFDGFAHEDKPRKSIVISGEFKEEGFIERAQKFEWFSDEQYVEIIDTLLFEEEGFSFILNEKDGQENTQEIASTPGLDVLFIDSLGTLFGGKENDNSELVKVMRFLMKLASKNKIAIVVIHHSRKRLAKEQEKPLMLDDVIGGNAISRYAHTVIAIEYSKVFGANVVSCLKSWGKHFKRFTYKIKEGLYSTPYLEINLEPGEIEIDTLTGATKKSALIVQPSQAEIQREKILTILKTKESKQATTAEIRDILGIDENDSKGTNALNQQIKRMVTNGEIIKPDGNRGVYGLPESDKTNIHEDSSLNTKHRF